jgi:hypothetical protein
MDHKSYGNVRLYQGVLILRQSYHGDYAYPGGRVVVLDDDEMTFSIRVPAVRCAWVPVAASCCVRHLILSLPKNPAPWMLIR